MTGRRIGFNCARRRDASCHHAPIVDSVHRRPDDRAVPELPTQRCPRCGEILVDIKGSRLAVCRRCGYKDDCC
jgi:ribosomal protein S27AE